MATVTVQIGQCGNQIGTQLFSILHSDADALSTQGARATYRHAVLGKFFSPSALDGQPSFAKAVLIDMEPKAVQASLTEARRGGSWLYDPVSVYKGQKGSGNNWANGFYCHGPRANASISDIIQREVEKCDYFEGFLVLMSVAGGTGSGMGTYITETLRDEYPNSVLVNPVIWPYASGEVIVQNYNALLTTSHLSQSSDAIVLLPNDHLHATCSKCLRLKEVSFTDLNKVASHSLASVLQPAVPSSDYKSQVHSRSPDRFLSRFCSLSDLCSFLTPHPNYRFLSIKSVPQIPDRSHAYTADLWPGLLKHLRQMLVTNSPTDEGMDWSVKPSLSSSNRIRSLANLVIARGKELQDFGIEGFKDPNLYCDWVPNSMRCSMWTSDHTFNKYWKSCSLVSNSSNCLKPLNLITEKAWRMFSAKAYVHQYGRFGLSEDHFMEAFLKVEQIMKDYSSL